MEGLEPKQQEKTDNLSCCHRAKQYSWAVNLIDTFGEFQC